MSEIQYMEKPDWVSWEAIHDCLVKSHVVNEKKGFHMTNQDMGAEGLQKKLRNGHCFVALEGERVVGVHGLAFVKMNQWWTKEVVAYNCLDGILPEYKGTDVYFELQNLRMKCIKESKVNIIQCNTAENNNVIIKICKKKGYKMVRYSATGRGANYYSVIMAKWINGCPYSDRYCSFMFKLSKYFVKAIWKPGYKFRYWF